MATALGTLSSFAILGLREHQELFLAQMADLTGTPAKSLPAIQDFQRTIELSSQLKEVPEAQLLIEQDLEVYHHVKSAVEGVLVD